MREVAFKGKGIVRSTLPADAHFYTGGSKALRYHLQPETNGQTIYGMMI